MKERTEIVERERWRITSGMRIQSFLALVVIATLCLSHHEAATTPNHTDATRLVMQNFNVISNCREQRRVRMSAGTLTV